MAEVGFFTARGGVLPDGVRVFLRRRLIELGGIVVVGVGALWLVALASYAPSDPSLNHAIAGPTENLLGRPGAYAADLALQTLGLAAAILGLMIAVWGWRILRHRRITRWSLRITLLPVAMVLASVACAAVSPPVGWPIDTGLGGAIGWLSTEHLVTWLAPLGAGTAAIAAAAGTAAVALLIVVSAVPWLEWRHAGLRATHLVGHAVAFARKRAAADTVQPKAKRRRTSGTEESPAAARREPKLDIATESESVADTLEVDGWSAPKAAALVPPADTTAKKRAGNDGRDGQRSFDLAPRGAYVLPNVDLLRPPAELVSNMAVDEQALTQNARLLESVLDDFGVRGEIVKVRPGPVVTLYELEPAPGTKSSRVIGLADDIARSMSAISVRIAVVPGRSVIGIELPNASRETVYLRELLAANVYKRTNANLPLVLGKDISGAPVVTDLSRMPHLLIAGTTGSGKSVAINTMILSLLYRLSPEECKFIMIDPKMLELSVYDDIPHLLAPVVTDPKKSVVALKWTVREMEDRYQSMSKLGVRNIAGYNARLAEARKRGEVLARRVQTGFDEETGKPIYEDQPLDLDPLPYIVVIVDEMADLMLVAGKEVEAAIQRLAQMARAAGIHLVMATQRPSVDVITGTIKANFPTRISFQVTSKIDSRTILGEQGAEQLLGQGDMLYMAGGGRITRVHGPFVADDEVEKVVRSLKAQGEPRYVEDVTEDIDVAAGIPGFADGESGDDLYDQAVALVCREGKASTSFVQRHLQIGYNRAARLIERMETEGVISPANHVGKREILAGHH